MTIDQITTAVVAVKPVSRRQVIRYLKACEIKPMGVRQKPQLYPENAVDVILMHLGLAKVVSSSSAGTGVAAGHSVTNGVALRKSARIPTLPELRNARKKARAAK